MGIIGTSFAYVARKCYGDIEEERNCIRWISIVARYNLTFAGIIIVITFVLFIFLVPGLL